MRVIIDNGNPYNLTSSITKRKLNPFWHFDIFLNFLHMPAG